jgi:hypothetical protein
MKHITAVLHIALIALPTMVLAAPAAHAQDPAPSADLTIRMEENRWVAEREGPSQDIYFTVGNRGPSTATGVVVDLALPQGVVFERTSSFVDCTAVTGGIRCTIPELASGAFSWVPLSLRATRDAPPFGGPVTAEATSQTPDPTTANNRAAATFWVNATEADLAVSGSLVYGRVTPGASVSLSINVSNRSTDTSATGVTVTAAGERMTLTPQSQSADGLNYRSGKTLWVSATVDADAEPGSTVTAVFTVKADYPFDPDPANNTLRKELTVVAPAGS